MSLQIGDRIKLLHQNTEGTLKQVYPNGLALVELDGEFEVEVLLKEIVSALPPDPKKAVAQRPRVASPMAATLADGLYISVRFRDDGTWHYELANHTPATVVFGLWTQNSGARMGTLTGQVEPRTARFLFKADSGNWQSAAHLVFQVIYFELQPTRHLAPQIVEFRLKPKHFQQERKPHAYSTEPAILAEMQLWEPLQNPLAAAETPAATEAGHSLPTFAIQANLLTCERPPELVDLHIDKLLENYQDMLALEMKDHQMKVFEDCLSKAVAHQYRHITFIHGIGDGKLRKAIHRRLDHHPAVRKHEPLQDGLFGHGATKVIFK